MTTAAHAALPVPAGVAQQPLTLERVFASPSLAGSTPRGVKLSPDGRYLTMLRNRTDELERYDLWALDTNGGNWRMLVDSKTVGSGAALSEAEKMQRERKRLAGLRGIVTYDWSQDGKKILVPLDGDLYLAGLDGTVKRLTQSKEGELNPVISPKGKYVSFVRDQKLWAGPVGVAAKAITPGGGTVHYGEAEFVAQEELDRFTGYWWSPNDDRIAVQWFDEKNVGIVTRTSIGAEETTTFEQRYPAAGTPNIVPHLILTDPDGRNKVEVDLGVDKDIYLARVDWAKDGKTLFVQRLSRAQDRIDMLAVDPKTGKSRLLFSDKAAAGHWINLTDNYRILGDGSIIWWSERDGLGQLYRFNDGQWTRLTDGKSYVMELEGVDEAGGRIFYQANPDVVSPQIYSLDLAKPGTAGRLLTDPAFKNSASMDEEATRLIVTRSSPEQPSQVYLADTSGRQIAWVEENRLDAKHPYAPYLASHEPTRYGTIKAADGSDLHYMMVVPSGLKPGQRAPVFFEHYGGPHNQSVTRSWSGALTQYLVDRGYIYFELDNRGSANRSVAFEKQINRAMGGVEVEDQKAGVQFLKTLPFVDGNKIATYGWSYGGYMTLKMLEADPGLYAAGIAGAPVTKWELYDTAYTERYLGNPNTEPDSYERSNALADAGKIRDPLLVIHGMSDDNVVFQNSTVLFAKLQQQGVPFDIMVYPGATHAVAGEKLKVHTWKTILRFLDQHLKGSPTK
ncbi:S9 family peptidase [Sphingomonas piscis]|uniref:S9 family peptidase n=1 Tax=Sphingomonas piscis TaxID=2714943 RepID=A0A6G7YTP2_9SPHN|nr:DPP IV N-terminal domain-containing protein [Sphingomonas piscis]QIK80110.1 S9 family peptidase [Sphingomonas piscis]